MVERRNSAPVIRLSSFGVLSEPRHILQAANHPCEHHSNSTIWGRRNCLKWFWNFIYTSKNVRGPLAASQLKGRRRVVGTHLFKNPQTPADFCVCGEKCCFGG